MTLPTIVVIMAGGTGSRFWPLSHKKRPKQLLHLIDPSCTLLEESIRNASLFASSEQILIAASAELETAIRDAAADIPPQNVLAEPLRRNTAGCLAFATAHILARFETYHDDLVMALMTADHHIGKPDLFLAAARSALAFAEAHESLVVFGMKPTRPETGYGYIEVAESAKAVSGNKESPVFPVNRFHEKPSLEQARLYLASGRFYWNSGLYIWRITTLLKSLEQWAPQWADSIYAMRDVLRDHVNNKEKIHAIFERLPDRSIDYALMEKADNLVMIPGDFAWDDVSTWDALSRFWPRDENGNVIIGDAIADQCGNVTIYNEMGLETMPVGVVGLTDAVVVATSRGLLVCSKEHVHDVKKIVDALRENGYPF
ncbi:MAG: hypothetical protein C4527_00165 [Candidatus Omnitrophota bacterium]|jgi:mannose-1-phosphate guanylyltransferase|nr:MAG: hypothetical protein C4527_00165 [Candidatus Omnitrophota bacterium]